MFGAIPRRISSAAIFVALMLCAILSTRATAATYVAPSDSNFNYIGRWNLDNLSNNQAVAYLGGSYVDVQFSGTSVTAIMSYGNWGEELDIAMEVDGVLNIRTLKSNANQWKLSVGGLSRGTHRLRLYRQRSTTRDKTTFHGLELDDGNWVSKSPAFSSCRIDVFGDSATDGSTANCANTDRECGVDSAYHAWPRILGDKLNARLNNNAISGLGVLNGYGTYNVGNDKPGLENTYDQSSVLPDGRGYGWNLNSFKPQVVIFGMGINDFGTQGLGNNYGGTIDDYNQYNRWKNAYKDVTRSLRSSYGNNTHFVFTVPVIPGWSRQVEPFVEEVANELAGEGIATSFYTMSIPGETGKHPGRQDHRDMAEEMRVHLANFSLGACSGDADQPTTPVEPKPPVDSGSLGAVIRMKDNWQNRYIQTSSEDPWLEQTTINLNEDWWSMQWVPEQVSGNTYRFKNRWTGLYLNALNEDEWSGIVTAPLENSWGSMKWSIEKVDGNRYRIKNEWTGHYLASQEGDGAVLRQAALRSDWSSQIFSLENVD